MSHNLDYSGITYSGPCADGPLQGMAAVRSHPRWTIWQQFEVPSRDGRVLTNYQPAGEYIWCADHWNWQPA